MSPNRRSRGRLAAFAAVAAAMLAALVVVLAPVRAFAQPEGSTGAPAQVKEALREGQYTFCAKPRAPLTMQQRELCPLAAEIDGCEALVAACKGEVPAEPKNSSTWRSIVEALGTLAQLLVWVLVAVVIVAIGAPLVVALLRARRDKAVADAPKRPNVATAAERAKPPRAETIDDAEAALREADEHARRGELARAMSLYLAASLASLDRRGAIRLARHRTNGEYVRSCANDPSCWPLRDIVREVDRVEFGKVPPTSDGVARVASRAIALVRGGGGPAGRGAASTATGLLMILALALMGCGGGSHRPIAASDPAGDELPIDVLQRSGYAVSRLSKSLAALPMPETTSEAHTPVLVVDVERVALEDESSAHLLRWVEQGGVLVLLGSPRGWPADLEAIEAHAANDSDSVEVITEDVYARGARVGTVHALQWPGSEAVAFIAGTSVYAAHKSHGKGAIVGVAGRELFTNLGASRPDNAGALAALLDIAMIDRAATDEARGVAPATTFEVHVARRQDGIPPPSNPFSALVQAGLRRGAWHALAFAVVLFLAFGIRHARARPAVPPARRAFAEHVEATGAFYGRAGALGHALASYGRFAELRLRERMPRGADPVQLLATRAKVPTEEAARVWRRATEASAGDPPRGDELATIRDLGAMLSSALRAQPPDARPVAPGKNERQR